ESLDPLQTFAVAAVLGLPRRRVEGALQATMSLLSQCLGTGEDVALVLRDIGVLLVERHKVQMRFYHNFLEAVSGKENLEKGVFKIQELLDMVAPQGVPVAALTSFGSIIIFPEFKREMVQAPLPR
ncbi:CCD81 protein, partial [Locustella ochotensis]|nr:CCD81 protein [Locustella ochotensis]